MLLAAHDAVPPAELVDLFVALAKPDGTRTAFELARDSAPGRASGPARVGRPLAQGAAQARGSHPRPVRGDRRRERRGHPQGHGVRRSARRPGPERDPHDPARRDGVVKHAATAEQLPRRLVRTADRGPRRHRGACGRLGAPPARPRRPDLHRPARPLRDRPARVPPRERSRGARARTRAALRGRGQRGRHGHPARSAEREPEPGHRRDRARGEPARDPGRRRDPAIPGRQRLGCRRDHPPAPPLARPAPPPAPAHDRAAPPGHRDHARDPQRSRLPGDRDAVPHALDPGRGARLPGARPDPARARSTRCRNPRSCSSSC